jgi:thiaminase/transcriptional activator TenA
MNESFSAQLWSGITDIYQAIREHPFITGLTDGSLPADAFGFYVVQDALYLREYSAALAVLASRAPDTHARTMFARHSADAVATELELHGSLFPRLGISADDVAIAEPAPVTLAYTSYLLSVTSRGSYAEGVAAVLPCYWIYREVGKELIRRGSADARYQLWIDTYGGEEFGEVVAEVLAETDALAPLLSAADRAAAHRHFRVASRYEWMFWEMGYRQESWTI